MKIYRKVLAFLLSITLGLFVFSTVAYAGSAASSNYQTPTINGAYYYQYSVISTNSSSVTASTYAHPINQSVGSGWIGGQAKLYNSSGALVYATSYQYNSGSVSQGSAYITSHWQNGSYGTSWYSHGYAEYWNGNGYANFQSYKSPNQTIL